eukprot:TRINITY_DN39605_c0_g1_i1.p2 TRINITY_DN39605_c0_g1~~TRINITY_DN39605_c0_g1_i1.p2  ORF type:complete len:344 (+),score=93.74 TRINITY_DN39605_c0_g1_i1:58-1089(+)
MPKSGKGVNRATLDRLNRERGQPTRARPERGRAVDAHRGGKSKKRKGQTDPANVVIHPKSRKAKQLWRQFGKDKKKVERSIQGGRKDKARQLRWTWFRDKLLTIEADVLIEPQVVGMVVEYVQRNDAELKELRRKRERQHQQHGTRPVPTGRERDLQGVRDEEATQAEQGQLEGPLMTTKRAVRLLRAWDGQQTTMRAVPTTMMRVPDGVDNYRPFTMGAAPARAALKVDRVSAKEESLAPQKARAGRMSAVQKLQQQRRAQQVAELRGAAPGQSPFSSPPRRKGRRRLAAKAKPPSAPSSPGANPFKPPEGPNPFRFDAPGSGGFVPQFVGDENPFERTASE